MTTKPLTVQAVVGLLRCAGFERSNRHRPGVSRHEATTGFAAWATASRFAPSGVVVAVAHFDAGQYGNFVSDDEAREAWGRHVASARPMLSRYADAIRSAGYAARLNFAAEDPYIVITEQEPTP